MFTNLLTIIHNMYVICFTICLIVSHRQKQNYIYIFFFLIIIIFILFLEIGRFVCMALVELLGDDGW